MRLRFVRLRRLCGSTYGSGKDIGICCAYRAGNASHASATGAASKGQEEYGSEALHHCTGTAFISCECDVSVSCTPQLCVCSGSNRFKASGLRHFS